MFRFFEASILRQEFRHTLETIQYNNPTAEDQKKSECCRSGVCCWRRPGELNQDDVPKLAAFLGLTPNELFAKYLTVDRYRGDYYLRLIRADDTPGTMLSWEGTYNIRTPCVFLDTQERKCKVHEAKPSTCAHYKCWVDEEPLPIPVWAVDQLKELGWDGVDEDDTE